MADTGTHGAWWDPQTTVGGGYYSPPRGAAPSPRVTLPRRSPVALAQRGVRAMVRGRSVAGVPLWRGCHTRPVPSI